MSARNAGEPQNDRRKADNIKISCTLRASCRWLVEMVCFNHFFKVRIWWLTIGREAVRSLCRSGVRAQTQRGALIRWKRFRTLLQTEAGDEDSCEVGSGFAGPRKESDSKSDVVGPVGS